MKKNLIEILLWLIAVVGSVLLALLIVGCAAPHRIEGSGERAMPPWGWVEFCQTNPKHEACAKDKNK